MALAAVALLVASPAPAAHRACTTILSDNQVDRILGPTTIRPGEHRYVCNYQHARFNTIVDLWPNPNGMKETAKERFKRLKRFFGRADRAEITKHSVRGADAAFSYAYCSGAPRCEARDKRPGGFVARDGKHLVWLDGGARFVKQYRRLARAMVRRL